MLRKRSFTQRSFTREPWPQWHFRLTNDLAIEQELFVRPGESAIFLAWRFHRSESESPGNEPIRLFVRPFFSGRDFHGNHHENPAFRFTPESGPGVERWSFYDGVPKVTSTSTA